MTVFDRRRINIVLVAIAAGIAAFFLADSIETSLARSNAEAAFPEAVADMESSIETSFDGVLFYLARRAAQSVGTCAGASSEDAVRLAKVLGLDELNVVDSNGIIRATTHASQIGVDMKSKSAGEDPDPEKSPEGFYLHLVARGEPWYLQAPRKSYNTDGRYRKFFGVPLPKGGGYVQIGIDFDRIPQAVTFCLADLAHNWTVGEDGYFIIARESDGEVVSDGGAADRGGSASTLAEFGFDADQFPATKGQTFQASVLGRAALCRTFVDKALGQRVIVVFPRDAMMHTRNASLVAVTFLMGIVIAIAAGLALQRVSDQEREATRAAEEQERRRSDLALASTIQAASLPRVFPPFPDRREIDLFAHMKPAREIGGDFYDFFFVTPDRVAMLVADVSGKGVPAALFMMRARTLLRSQLAMEPDLGKAVAETNAALAENNDTEMFVTAWVGIADLVEGRVDYVNAGHNPPILRHADGTQQWLRQRSGFILAGMPDSRYTAHSFPLRPGDRLVLYTDGVTEAANPDQELYGEKRLARAVSAAPEMPELLCAAVTADVADFERGAAPADDLTLLCFAFHGLRRRFAAVRGALRDLSAFVEAAAGDDPKWLVAADEIGANIVHHSGANFFDVAVSADASGMRLTFSDDGAPFDPLSKADPDVTASAEDRAIGGLGIYMVKKTMDSVTYRRDGDRNVLTLFRRRT